MQRRHEATAQQAEQAMTATVRDERGIAHVAIRLPVEEDAPGESKNIEIGALCEDTVANLFAGSFTVWTVDEIEEGLPDCMTCLVRHDNLGPIQSVT